MENEEIAKLFYCGKYNEVLQALGKGPLFKNDSTSSLWPYQIGALIFTGDFIEALTLYELALKQKKLNQNSISQARFFIGIGLVRKSRYAEATSYFANNLNDYKKTRVKKNNTKHSNWLQAFYAYQGAAFFRFFHSRFKRSRILAEKAYAFAFEGDFLFGQAFAAELMGHCNCQLGEVHKGLNDLKKAILCADKIGNGGLSGAFQIAHEKFKAQYGVDHKNSEKNLFKSIRTLKPEDTYSRAELYLELARQLILRGKCSRAKELLDENAEVIYKHQNRRQSALFNLRYAHILHLQGESKAALTLIRSSRGNLVNKVDTLYFQQLQGLENKILNEINFKHEESSRQIFNNFIDERIYSRKHTQHKMYIRSNEDHIGDIIDGINRQTIDLTDLHKQSLLGLIPSILNVPSSQAFIYLGPTRGEMIIQHKGDTHWISEGVIQPMIKILQLLEGGELKTKETIINKTWGYEYRPDRHDNLLQATIAKLRKLLGPFAHWIEWHSGGYRLLTEVRILQSSLLHNAPRQIQVHTPQEQTIENKKPPSLSIHDNSLNDLNHRQIKLIKQLKDGSFIGVTEYAKTYKICKMTACRDLTSLSKRNILKKYGKARATQYTLRGRDND